MSGLSIIGHDLETFAPGLDLRPLVYNPDLRCRPQWIDTSPKIFVYRPLGLLELEEDHFRLMGQHSLRTTFSGGLDCTLIFYIYIMLITIVLKLRGAYYCRAEPAVS